MMNLSQLRNCSQLILMKRWTIFIPLPRSFLENYHVQDWKTNYTDGDSDGTEDGEEWELILQYEDGSVKKHIGNADDLKPEGFRGLADELYQFVENHME